MASAPDDVGSIGSVWANAGCTVVVARPIKSSSAVPAMHFMCLPYDPESLIIDRYRRYPPQARPYSLGVQSPRTR